MNNIDNDNDKTELGPEYDIVEDFARQLEQVCSISPVKTKSNDDNHTTKDQDSDDDNDSMMNEIPFGYQQLAQDEDEGVSLTEDDGEDIEEEPMLEQQEPPTVSLDESEEIPKDTANTIKSIMNNIKMPDHAVPEWAKTIPESMWLPRYQQTQSQEGDNSTTTMEKDEKN
ncbi:hypothetical protein INT45_009631, partial [Circinella minor]